MTLWVFDLSTDPTGEFSRVEGYTIPPNLLELAGDVSRALSAADRLRQEAKERKDPCILFDLVPVRMITEILQLLGDGAYVGNVSDRIYHVQRYTFWRIIDARTLSVEDGKVVASAKPDNLGR